jgi:hypothetical protein
MLHRFVRTATIAGLVGLVILHPEPFGKLLGGAVSTFRQAVRLG